MSSRHPVISSRGARWSLLWGLVFFVGGELAFTVAMARWRPELGDPEFGHKLSNLWQRLAEEPASRPLVLVLGSSRAAMGIRPEVLNTSAESPLVFNFALVGSGPVMELCCLRRLLAEGIRPRQVLVEFWPPFWYQEGPYAEEHRLHVNRMGWSDLTMLGAYSADPDCLYRNWWQARLWPAFFSRFGFMNRFAPAWLPLANRVDLNWKGLDEWGWLRCPFNSRDAATYRIRLEDARSFYVPIFEHFRISAVADRALRELVQLCEREGIAVTLFQMPEGADFRGWYPPAVRTATDAYLAGLGHDHALEVIDGRTWADDDDLLDGFHLLPDGAARFTARLQGELLNPVQARRTHLPGESKPE